MAMNGCSAPEKKKKKKKARLTVRIFPVLIISILMADRRAPTAISNAGCVDGEEIFSLTHSGLVSDSRIVFIR